MRGRACRTAALASLRADLLRSISTTLPDWIRRFRRDERGVATIELALILPIVTVLLMGLLDIGIFVHREMDLRNAARMGAQYAFQDSSALSTMESTAVNAVGPLPSGASTPVASATAFCECPTSTSDYSATAVVACTTATCPVTGTKPATYITVTLTQSYTPLFGSWGLVHARTMTATATLRVN